MSGSAAKREYYLDPDFSRTTWEFRLAQGKAINTNLENEDFMIEAVNLQASKFETSEYDRFVAEIHGRCLLALRVRAVNVPRSQGSIILCLKWQLKPHPLAASMSI